VPSPKGSCLNRATSLRFDGDSFFHVDRSADERRRDHGPNFRVCPMSRRADSRRVGPCQCSRQHDLCRHIRFFGRRRGRILGFGWSDPNLGIQKAKDEVKRCIDEFGFYGVKLNGAQNDYSIDDPKLRLPLLRRLPKQARSWPSMWEPMGMNGPILSAWARLRSGYRSFRS